MKREMAELYQNYAGGRGSCEEKGRRDGGGSREMVQRTRSASKGRKQGAAVTGDVVERGRDCGKAGGDGAIAKCEGDDGKLDGTGRFVLAGEIEGGSEVSWSRAGAQ
jgi:hypothetical protein